MKEKQKDIHLKVEKEEWFTIKMEAMKRGLSMKDFILGCIVEIIDQDKKYQ